MDLPTEFEIDSILKDLDVPKKPSLISSKPVLRTLVPKNDEQKLLDDLIAHLDDESFLPSKTYEPLNSCINASSDLKVSTPKCATIYLGGSSDSCGLFIGGKAKFCDRLRCIGCDFKVLIFPKFKWAADVDYLFFRNSMPEAIKLNTKLEFKDDSNAYCCQCQWTSTNKILEPNLLDCTSFNHLKWTCRGH
jgi:hypothetical protein